MTADGCSTRPVLLVEDDPGLTRLIELVMTRAGIANDLVAVGSGEAARAFFLGATEAPALVLCDLGLPDVDGVQLIRWIRSRFDKRRLPLVVLSGSVATPDVDLALRAGATEFLRKPVGIDVLLDTLEQAGLQRAFDAAS
jgi:two-component system KDP operon response regulator KdpE